MDLNIKKIKKDLEYIYENYLLDKKNKEIKSLAAKFYNEYKDLDPILKPEIASAIRNLVDIAFDTGIKKDDKEIKEILNKLKRKEVLENDNS